LWGRDRVGVATNTEQAADPHPINAGKPALIDLPSMRAFTPVFDGLWGR